MKPRPAARPRACRAAWVFSLVGVAAAIVACQQDERAPLTPGAAGSSPPNSVGGTGSSGGDPADADVGDAPMGDPDGDRPACNQAADHVLTLDLPASAFVQSPATSASWSASARREEVVLESFSPGDSVAVALRFSDGNVQATRDLSDLRLVIEVGQGSGAVALARAMESSGVTTQGFGELPPSFNAAIQVDGGGSPLALTLTADGGPIVEGGGVGCVGWRFVVPERAESLVGGAEVELVTSLPLFGANVSVQARGSGDAELFGFQLDGR